MFPRAPAWLSAIGPRACSPSVAGVARYTASRVDGLLKDATHPSRVKSLSPNKFKQVVVHMTLHENPPNAISKR